MNPNIILSFCSIENPSKNQGKGNAKVKGEEPTKLKWTLKKQKPRLGGQGSSPHAHIFQHTLKPNSAQAIAPGGGGVEEEFERSMVIKGP
jgi:hypothetical protein